jgi:hypothetical protein
MNLYSEHSAASSADFKVIQLMCLDKTLHALTDDGSIWARELLWDDREAANIPTWYQVETPAEQFAQRGNPARA